MRYLLEQEELFDYLSSQGATYGYARTSSDNQIDNFSIPGQGDNIRDFAKRKGLNLRRIIVDEAKSGKNMEREGLQYFLNHIIKEEKVEALVVNTLNRLARNSYHIHMIKDILEQHGVKLFVIEGGLSTENASSRLLFNMIGAFDEYDGENIVFQAKQGSIKRAELGLHNGNRVLGYNNVETEYGVKMLQINPEESKIVKQIYDLYERGHGMRTIANRLNQEGHRTKRGNLFSTTSIRDILDRELYRGNISYNENENYRVKGRSKTSENHVLTKGQHEAIVSNEQWEHVQYLRKKNSFHPNKTRRWGAILTGLLVCPQCGAKMTISNSSTKNKAGEVIKRRYYVCSQFKSKGRTACKANGVRVEVIEDLVKQGLNEIITYPEVLQQTVAFTWSLWKSKKNH